MKAPYNKTIKDKVETKMCPCCLWHIKGYSLFEAIMLTYYIYYSIFEAKNNFVAEGESQSLGHIAKLNKTFIFTNTILWQNDYR